MGNCDPYSDSPEFLVVNQLRVISVWNRYNGPYGTSELPLLL